ncbi:hypothetical protein ACYZX9_11240 [Sphingomonas citri]
MTNPANQAFDRWWSELSRSGDPKRRPDIAVEAFAAGWDARGADSEDRCRLDLTLFEAKALRNQLRGIVDPPAIVGTVLEALANRITNAERVRP